MKIVDMSEIEILKKFVEERLDWNNFLHKKDPKPSDVGRMEEDKCILRYIEKMIKDESTDKGNPRCDEETQRTQSQ